MGHVMKQHNGLVVPQDRETPMQVGRHAGFAWRYAYHRSADTRKANDPGQDYLTFRYSDRAFVFALCDGVGQSFFGDLASRFLGDALMDWLWNHLPPELNPEPAVESLNQRLGAITGDGSRLVRSQRLPTGIPKMLYEVLEQKRSIGSESTFACGRIDLPGGDYPDGRMVLAWMGDSRIRMWGPGGERTAEFGDTFKTEQRWSTRVGPVRGKPNMYMATLRKDGQYNTSQLAVYSDGLASLDPFPRTPSTDDMESLIARAVQSPTSDDISFLEIGIQEASPMANEKKAAMPAPEILSTRVLDRTINASWQAIGGANHYQVELDNGKTASWDVRTTVWSSPPLEPSSYRLRVRGVGDEPGEWSKETTIVVPDPQPSAPNQVATSPLPVATGTPNPAAATATAATVAPTTGPGTATTAMPATPPASQAPLAVPRAVPPQAAPPVAPSATVAAAPKGGLPIAAIIGGVVLLLIVLAVVAFLVLGNSSGGSGKNPSQQAATTTPLLAAVGAAAVPPTSQSAGDAATPVPSLTPAAPTYTPTQQPAGSTGSTGAANGGGAAAGGVDVATIPTPQIVQASPPAAQSSLQGLATLAGFPASITSLAFSPDATLMAVGSGDGKVRVFRHDGNNWSLVLTRGNSEAAIQAVAFSPDGAAIAAGSGDGRVILWVAPGQQGEGGGLIRQLEGHNDAVNAISYSPDGSVLATGSSDKTVRVWNLSTGNLALPNPLEAQSAVRAVAFSSDGKLIAAGSDGGTIRTWDAGSGAAIRTIDNNAGAIRSVAFKPNSHILVVAAANSTVTMWSADSGASAGILSGHKGPVNSVAFSPDGQLLASGSDDNQVVIWRVSTLDKLLTLPNHIARVTGVAFGPQGKVLATASEDGTVSLWGTANDTAISSGLLGATSGQGSSGAMPASTRSEPKPTPTSTPGIAP